MKNRIGTILEMLTKEHKIEVSTLSQRLGVSQVTVRKDLDELERRGVVKREHGYALLGNENDVAGRIAYHFEAKLEIAKRAAQLVRDGETLMIESGSCCALLAAELAGSKRDVTIITNSAFIADYTRGKGNARVILTGGVYQPDSQALVGPMVRQGVENFWVDSFFIGTDGWSERTGFTNRDPLRAQAVRDMAAQAEQVVVLTESEKFSKRGVAPLNLKNQSIAVITDKGLSAETESALKAQVVSVLP